MFSFDQLKINQIPIWENRRRIEYLTLFRDLILYCEGVPPYHPDSPLIAIFKSSGPMNPPQRRSAVSERIPRARQMMELSGIKLRRVCSCTDPNRPPTIEIDVLEQVFELIRLGVSSGKTTDVVDESIGLYKHDQDKARRRTRNPLFWLAWSAESIVEAFIHIIGWIAEIPVRLVSRIFRLDQEKAVRSWYGRSLTGLSALSLWIFALIQTLRALGLLDWWDSLLQAITHH